MWVPSPLVGTPYPSVGAPLVGALPPLVGAPYPSVGAPLVGALPPSWAPTSSIRRGTPCGCPPPLWAPPYPSVGAPLVGALRGPLWRHPLSIRRGTPGPGCPSGAHCGVRIKMRLLRGPPRPSLDQKRSSSRPFADRPHSNPANLSSDKRQRAPKTKNYPLTPAVPPCSSPLQFPPAVPPCSSPLQFPPAVPPCSSPCSSPLVFPIPFPPRNIPMPQGVIRFNRISCKRFDPFSSYL